MSISSSQLENNLGDIFIAYSDYLAPLINCSKSRHGTLVYSRRLSVATFTLGFLAFLSNFLFLITVVKHPQLRRTHLRMLLVTLSVIDAMVSLSYVSLGVQWFADALDHTINVHVQVALIFRFPFQLVACLIIIVVSVERYLAVRDPFKQMSSANCKSSSCSVGAVILCIIALLYTVMVVSYVLIAPGQVPPNDLCVTSYGATVKDRDKGKTIILLEKASLIIIVSSVLVAIEIISVVVSVSLSVMIYRMLGQLPSTGEESHRLHLREQNNLTKMVIANTAVFCLCVSLSDVFTCIYFSLGSDRFNYALPYITVTVVVTLLNSLLNPIVYNVFGSVYRHAFLETYPCMKSVLRWCYLQESEESHNVTLASMT